MHGHGDRILVETRKNNEEKPWLSHLFVVRSFMNEMIILEVFGILVGTYLYLKGGVLYVKHLGLIEAVN